MESIWFRWEALTRLRGQKAKGAEKKNPRSGKGGRNMRWRTHAEKSKELLRTIECFGEKNVKKGGLFVMRGHNIISEGPITEIAEKG